MFPYKKNIAYLRKTCFFEKEAACGCVTGNVNVYS